jgi:hypothetical protein
MEKKEYTIQDIEQTVIIVQINGNAHQVLISKEDKEVIIQMINGLTNGLKLSEEMMPVTFEFKQIVK